jgi:3-deoxy-D-manno-octulosonic acid kinase
MSERTSTPLTLPPEAWSIQPLADSSEYLIVPADDINNASADASTTTETHASHSADEAPTVDWFNPEYWQAQHKITGTNTGRGITYFIQEHDLKMVLRRYLRGGLIAKLITQSFWFTGLTRTRVYQEIALLNYMRSCDLPVPRPIAGLITRHFGVYYRNAILIERIADAQDLHAYLLQQSLPLKIWTALGHTIARMHLAGVDHHDLNIENILLDKQEKLWLIDFDKCDLFTQVSPKVSKAWPVANIARLARSIRKQHTLHPTYHVSADDWTALITGYQTQLQTESPTVFTEINDKLSTLRI